MAYSYDLEISRITTEIINLIKNNNGVCPGFDSSIISSDNELVNCLVNIRRMDAPDEYVTLLAKAGFDPNDTSFVSLGWNNTPVFDSDISANIEAIKLGIIDGFYDFSSWENKISKNHSVKDYKLFEALDEIENDGVIAKTKYNISILKELGLSNIELNDFEYDVDSIILSSLTHVNITDNIDNSWSINAQTDGINYYFTLDQLKELNNCWDDDPGVDTYFDISEDGSSVSLHDGLQDLDFEVATLGNLYKFPTKWNWLEVDLNSNQKLFSSYSSDKTIALEPTEDVFGNVYPTIMKCSINNMNDCSVVYVKNKVDSLCWIDPDKQLHIDNNNAPDILAAQMSFSQIDSNYYKSLINNWNGLQMDELIDLLKTRSTVIDETLKGKEM